MAEKPWPFDQPRNCAVITLKSIAFNGQPILLVSHDEDDHGWQFLDGGPFDTASAAVVALETIVKLDPTVLNIADLPPGWMAIRRDKTSPWHRQRNQNESPEAGEVGVD